MNFARIVSGIVAETLTADAATSTGAPGIVVDGQVLPLFPAEQIWVGCDPAVLPGWAYASGLFTAPVPPALTLADLISYAFGKTAALSAVARSYTVGSGVTIKCDTLQGTGSDLAGLNAWGAANPTATTTWVDDFGVPTTITGAEGVTLALAVVAYGQSLYNKLGAVCIGIASSTITTTAEIDAAGWPT